MPYRIYLGPFRCGRVDLTHLRGEVVRGQEVHVTEQEAAAMDRLPKQWRNPYVPVNVPVDVYAYIPEATKSNINKKVEPVEIIVKRTKKRKTRKRKGSK